MNEFMQRLREAIQRLESANRITPLTARLSDHEMMRLVELVADSGMPAGQIVRLIERLNAGEPVFSLIDER